MQFDIKIIFKINEKYYHTTTRKLIQWAKHRKEEKKENNKTIKKIKQQK